MTSIHKLPSKVYNDILSGKTMQLQVYCAKELIENSLDSNCTTVTIQVDHKTCGLNYMAVTDNGTGIADGDRPLVCQPNHTLKIKSLGDLTEESFCTFGFRGEGLFFLRQLSKSGTFSISTKTATDKFGMEWSIDATTGKMLLLNRKVVTGDFGTKVTITGLFFHFPVRYKILCKDPSSSVSKLKEMLVSYSICHPSVRFYLKFVDYNPSSRKCISSKKCKDQVFTSGTLLLNSISIFLPKIANLERKFTSFKCESPVGFGCEININMHICANNIYSSKGLRVLAINKRPVMEDGLDSIYKKVSKVVSSVCQEFSHQTLSIWVVHISNVPNKFLDYNIEPSKTDICFTNPELEIAILDSLNRQLRKQLVIALENQIEAQTLPKDEIADGGHLEEEISMESSTIQTTKDSSFSEKESELQNPIADEWSFTMHDFESVPSDAVNQQRPSQDSSFSNEDLTISKSVSLSNPFIITKVKTTNLQQQPLVTDLIRPILKRKCQTKRQLAFLCSSTPKQTLDKRSLPSECLTEIVEDSSNQQIQAVPTKDKSSQTNLKSLINKNQCEYGTAVHNLAGYLDTRSYDIIELAAGDKTLLDHTKTQASSDENPSEHIVQFLTSFVGGSKKLLLQKVDEGWFSWGLEICNSRAA
ncbi:hypothetical protein HYPBUDRAFT_147263 [Hyphopichia burtonii NRRL Y-1933]|uniref:DNA mismatch repair protein S5 domain-containing protein n=1 Tax=Hyphopichia burtonii NRRL Y-1933 TaxID=984485 RepID=A0A1E4RN98_9ASCO|nr:hypothetical protein HYPBUDRAFT_147263 [Hyphopichia burtonii NRRL Y-1933]ODV68723.1 hypothetical protein HYPBUDRAFT_147263 [Hyphopichia burtonii NRRL Y-1933]